MVRACRTNGGGKYFIQDVGWKAIRKDNTGKAKT
jgi:hypothetical protein